MKKVVCSLLVLGFILLAFQPCWAGDWHHRGHHRGHHGGGIGPGAEIGLGFGAFAFGTGLGYLAGSSCGRMYEAWETRWRQEWDPWRGRWVSVPYPVRTWVPY